mgnify:CR=1 FL=1
MRSRSVTLVPCTSELVRSHRLGRINVATGAITEDFDRSNCYLHEGFFAYKGEIFVSDTCANGAVPKKPKEETAVQPICLTGNCKRT